MAWLGVSTEQNKRLLRSSIVKLSLCNRSLSSSPTEGLTVYFHITTTPPGSRGAGLFVPRTTKPFVIAPTEGCKPKVSSSGLSATRPRTHCSDRQSMDPSSPTEGLLPQCMTTPAAPGSRYFLCCQRQPTVRRPRPMEEFEVTAALASAERVSSSRVKIVRHRPPQELEYRPRQQPLSRYLFPPRTPVRSPLAH